MEIFIKDNGDRMKNMVKDFIDLVVVMFIKDILKMVFKVVKEYTENIMERIIEVIMKKVDYMVKVGLHFKMEIFKMHNGKMVSYKKKWYFMIVNHKELFINLIF